MTKKKETVPAKEIKEDQSSSSSEMSWHDVIQKSGERFDAEMEERAKAIEREIGRKVKHRTYLLEGVVTGANRLTFSCYPGIFVKWDNGAESSEHPSNLEVIS